MNLSVENKRLRRDALVIFQSALEAVDPYRCVCAHLTYDFQNNRIGVCEEGITLAPSARVALIAVGKASVAMARAVESVLGECLDAGIAVSPAESAEGLTKTRHLSSSHPLPDEKSVRAGRKVMALAESLSEKDCLIFCLSGGASALLELPAEPLSINDLNRTTDLLLKSGAKIEAVNTVRKHLSAVKGGQLARAVAPARILTLILSDCASNEIAVIGSGPTAPDPTTYEEARAVLERHGLLEKIPERVRSRIKAGIKGQTAETPKPGDPLFERVTHHLLAENRTALDGALEKAKKLGYDPVILQTFFEGEAREEAERFLACAEKEFAEGKTAVIAGAECVVTVKGSGKGGRNQEFAAVVSGLIRGRRGLCVLSAGTDGIDGPTPHAGGCVDGETLERAESRGRTLEETLKENDASAYLHAGGALVTTGPTGTNVMDLIVALKG